MTTADIIVIIVMAIVLILYMSVAGALIIAWLTDWGRWRK